MEKSSTKLLNSAMVSIAIKQSFVKLNPLTMLKNPVMFTVEIGTLIMAGVSIYSINNSSEG
ncbi:MAG: hypothetical protein EOO88_61170 [Pedobacter sp.]|nr:MAG: hypothetical protein EOO88_61170 [Pedobacter sp.]